MQVPERWSSVCSLALLCMAGCAPAGMGMSWKLTDYGNELSQPAILEDEGLVVFTDANELFGETPRVVALDLKNGDEVWESEGSRTLPVVSTAGEVIYATETELLCFDAAGVEQWRAPLDSGQARGVAVSDDGLIAVTQISSIQAFDLDGVSLWSVPVFRGQPSMAIAPDGTLHAFDESGLIYGISPEGEVLWERGLGFAVEQLMYQDGPVVMTATSVVGLDGTDGSDRWVVELPTEDETEGGQRGEPIVTEDGTLVLSTRFGVLGIEGGEVAWRGDVGCRGIAAADDGRLYTWCNIEDWLAEHRPLSGVQLFTFQHTVLRGTDGHPVWWPTKPFLEAVVLGGTGDPVGSPAMAKHRAVYTHLVNVSDVIAFNRAPGLGDTPWPRARGDNRNSGQAR